MFPENTARVATTVTHEPCLACAPRLLPAQLPRQLLSSTLPLSLSPCGLPHTDMLCHSSHWLLCPHSLSLSLPLRSPSVQLSTQLQSLCRNPTAAVNEQCCGPLQVQQMMAQRGVSPEMATMAMNMMQQNPGMMQVVASSTTAVCVCCHCLFRVCVLPLLFCVCCHCFSLCACCHCFSLCACCHCLSVCVATAFACVLPLPSTA